MTSFRILYSSGHLGNAFGCVHKARRIAASLKAFPMGGPLPVMIVRVTPNAA